MPQHFFFYDEDEEGALLGNFTLSVPFCFIGLGGGAFFLSSNFYATAVNNYYFIDIFKQAIEFFYLLH